MNECDIIMIGGNPRKYYSGYYLVEYNEGIEYFKNHNLYNLKYYAEIEIPNDAKIIVDHKLKVGFDTLFKYEEKYIDDEYLFYNNGEIKNVDWKELIVDKVIIHKIHDFYEIKNNDEMLYNIIEINPHAIFNIDVEYLDEDIILHAFNSECKNKYGNVYRLFNSMKTNIEEINVSEMFYIKLLEYYPLALEYINEQTEEMCFNAVEKDIKAFKYVINQTEELCDYVLSKDINMFEHVKHKTDKLCKKVLTDNPDLYYYIDNPSVEVSVIALENDIYLINFVVEKTNIIDLVKYIYKHRNSCNKTLIKTLYSTSDMNNNFYSLYYIFYHYFKIYTKDIYLTYLPFPLNELYDPLYLKNNNSYTDDYLIRNIKNIKRRYTRVLNKYLMKDICEEIVNKI